MYGELTLTSNFYPKYPFYPNKGHGSGTNEL